MELLARLPPTLCTWLKAMVSGGQREQVHDGRLSELCMLLLGDLPW